MPGPASATSTASASPATRAVTRIGVPGGVYFTAFSSKLLSTWSIST
jgi:hypothetical protein